MKYSLAILFVLFASYAFGQKYHTCEIYQYYGNDSNKKELVCTRVFNDKGKVVHQASKHYQNKDEDTIEMKGENGDMIMKYITGNYVIEVNGVYDYYYEDTFLLLKFFMDSSDYVDSEKTFYYYDENKLLCKTLLKYATMKIKYFTATADDTTLFFRDASHNIIEETRNILPHEHRAGGYIFQHKIKYNKQNKPITDSSYLAKGNISEALKYYYYKNSFKEVDVNMSGKNAMNTLYFTDGKGRIITKKWNDEAEKTTYFKDGRIKISRYYHKGNLATTHVFIYN